MKSKLLTHLLMVIGAVIVLPAQAVERWGFFETSFEAPAARQPWLDVTLSATFRQGERRIQVAGFWDGGGTFKIRFSPPVEGDWTYETASNQDALNGRTGAFTAGAATGDNHGPVEVFQTHYLRYADSAAYHQFGTTCYAWVHQPEATQEQTLKTLAKSPFNKIRFCVFPKHYTYNANEPDFFAFAKDADGKFDYTRPDPEFWRHFERRILDLQRLGIEADIILWHPYDRWGFKTMTDEQDDRYLRYAIARLAAFRNVWWSLANEYDFMSDLDGRRRGNKTMDDWDRFFSILQKEDPYARMRGIHNGSNWYDHTKDWVIHASLQTSDMNGGVRYRRQYGKPVIYDECKYEGDVPQGWGNLTAREMTQRFWLGTMSGCYVGHGETYQHPEDLLWWAKGGVLHGESPRRIQWLKDFMKTAPPFQELQPLGDDRGRFVLGKEGEYYLVYCLAGQTDTVDLPGNQPWKVDAIDPWEMRLWPEGSAPGGAFTVTAPAQDRAYRFTRYAPGERLRPVAQPSASVTAGVPPLKARFRSNSPHQVTWDFDDRATSDQTEPTHSFEAPGIYTVVMTVTDEHGGTARGHVTILVDHDASQPILKAGFGAGGNTPEMGLHGTAQRKADGGLFFKAGEPWGRAEAGEEAGDLLGGLRSFTISGWLKPDDLTIGSGGNRILFCLIQSKAGIDLVHLADGRLRLSVNEWPDTVRNESSPGRLVVGRWTFFAVAYDATQPRDNVAWYFSEPDNRLDASASVRLDRRTTYNVGAVAASTGPVAIGNFNNTMRGYGYDRQFRGEIGQLQVHGSRIGGGGAMASPAPPKP